MGLRAKKLNLRLALKTILQLILVLSAFSEATHAQSQSKVQCRATHQLTGMPPGESDCLQSYKISETQAPGLEKKIADAIESGDYYAIAISKSSSCNAVGFATIKKPPSFGSYTSQGTNQYNNFNENKHLDRALGSCRSQGCECAIGIDNGKVINFDLVMRFENQGKTEVAQSVKKDGATNTENVKTPATPTVLATETRTQDSEFLNAQQAYQRDISQQGLSAMKALGETGNKQAQGFLAQALWSGPKQVFDKAQAAKWAKLAAAQGEPAGQNVLANMYREGFTVPKDPKEALRLYKLSWSQGYNRAAGNIADIYYQGDGLTKDAAEGFKWLKMGAESGYVPAQHKLAIAYRDGNGTARSDEEATKLLTMLASRGDTDAMAELAHGYRKAFQKPDYKQAFEWASRSAEKNNRVGQEILGQLYLNGQGVEKDFSKAIFYFRLSAAQNNPWAQNALGNVYENGWGVQSNYDEAARWYLKAAAQGNEPAKKSLNATMAISAAAERAKLEVTSQTASKQESATLTSTTPKKTWGGFEEGQFLSKTMVIGAGRTLPLPDGKWRIELIRESTAQANWAALFLTNQDPVADLEAISLQIGNSTQGWPASVPETPEVVFLVDTHGTSFSKNLYLYSDIRPPVSNIFFSAKRPTGEDATIRMEADRLARIAFYTQFRIYSGNDRLIVGLHHRKKSAGSFNKILPSLANSASPEAKLVEAWKGKLIAEYRKAFVEKTASIYVALVTESEQATRLADIKTDQSNRTDKDRQSQPGLTLAEERKSSGQDRVAEERAQESLRAAQEEKNRETQRLANEALKREQLRLAEAARAKAEGEAKAKEQARVLAESEAHAKEQARVLAENKAQEQARLIEEARVKDEQRRLEDARVQQRLKLAEEARTKAESEVRLKEQERLQAERNAKERERQLSEAKDAELAALRSQLEKMKLQTAQTTAAVQMAKRKALVIGNDSYRFIAKLSNAREDARAVAENLAKVGYTVTLKTDLTEKEMKAAIRTFKSQVEAGDEVAIFYAGHGIQLENTNYLIPIDVAGDGAEQVKDEAISLQRVLDDMADRKAKLTLALIDACRDNPFKSSGRAIGQGRGLAPTTAATGQMVVFSAGTGQQALDNLGPSDKEKNGIFTRVFIREMTKPDRTVDAVVRQVRNEVVRMAKTVGHEQVPAIYDQVVGEFYFARSGQ